MSGVPSIELRFEDPRLSSILTALAEQIRAAGGRALVVGGAVRDALLGLPVRDLDLEVFGLPASRLLEVAARDYPLDLVGEAFGVLKLKGLPIDLSLPRRESKAGLGHRAFSILSDPTLSFAAAAARRDFTINAIGFDPLTGERLDPWNGIADLERKVLRHTSPQFCEDPLRVLRGMQFIARFNLAPAPETVALCRTIDIEGLPPERLFEEWRKLLLFGRPISPGLRFLEDCGWLRFFPELAALPGCPQEPDWHPEGDVWVHTLHCLDAFAAARSGDEWEDLVVGLAVLCHDLGKPATTSDADGRIRTLGHDVAGEGPTRTFLARLTRHHDLVEQVVPLVVHHLRPLHYFRDQSSDAAVRRLARSVGRIDRLVRVAAADSAGRPPLPDDGFPAGAWLLERARVLEVTAAVPKPLILGRHLLALDLSLTPGPELGRILAACYEAQLDGRFSTVEDGVAFAREWLSEQGQK